MTSVTRVGLGLLVAGFGVGVAAAQQVTCPGSPGYLGPSVQVHSDSSATSYGDGDPSSNSAWSDIDQLWIAEDPEDIEFDAQVAVEEFTWTLSVDPPQCLYTVNYYFKCDVACTVDVGGWNGPDAIDGAPLVDGDWAQGNGAALHKNDGGGLFAGAREDHTVTKDAGGLWTDYKPQHSTPIATKTCVGNGTAFSTTHKAEVTRAETRSQAESHVFAYYTDPLFFHQETLCQ